MNAFWKDLVREIKNSAGRFISLIVITLLGAASVIGIQATAIDMRDVADKTYKQQGLYDISIKSSVGFDDEDIAVLRATDGVAVVMPTRIFDAYMRVDGENRTVRAYALPDSLNTVTVLEGRLPENASECVLERRLMNEGEFAIGDTVALSLDNMDDYNEVFANDSYTIVGVVSSPLYISFQRGTTSLGDGELRYYLYVQPSAFVLEVYTDIYVQMDGSQTMNQLSGAYNDAGEAWERAVEVVATERVAAAEQTLDDARQELDEGWVDYHDGVQKFNDEIATARAELEDAQVQLADAKQQLEDGQAELDAKIADGTAELDKQATTIKSGQAKLDQQRAELNTGQQQVDAARAQVTQALEALQQQGPQGVSPELDAAYDELYASLAALEQQQLALDSGRAALDQAQVELTAGQRQLDEARNALQQAQIDGQRDIDDGWVDYHQGVADYEEGLATLATEQADGQAELDDALRELEDAERVLDDAPEPEWFVSTRKDGLAFDSYYQDTLRLEKIGYVFPLVFFLVAVMVSLTSMSRMVENHRTQIGIYKALGYHNGAILLKYLLYATSAGVIGGVAGVVFGSWMFPRVIADAYAHIYNFPSVETPVPLDIAAVAILSSLLAVVAVTLWTYSSSMKGAPALLMRPKPPAKGKRVLLERVTFLWRRLGFFSKVTVRNVFRYKKRVIMTLAGVAGCSALLLTAFGLRDSVGGVANMQYGRIVKFDMQVYVKDVKTLSQRDSLNALLPDSSLYIREEAVTASGGKGRIAATVFVPETPEELSAYIALYSEKSDTLLTMDDNSLLLTDKMAKNIGVTTGDSVTITMSDGRELTAAVTGVVENYLLHYIYMSPAMYQALFGAEPYPNSIIVQTDDGLALAPALLDNSNVRAVVQNEELLAIINESTDAMGVVTVVLILLACALALVVLFNLTNINISERIRELATIKVLGFNDNEMAAYIYRENGIITVLGIALGLVGGIFLHRFVITSVEVDVLKFPLIIQIWSYLIAVLLSAAFAIFVNLVMRVKLRKIDMVESLKAVE